MSKPFLRMGKLEVQRSCLHLCCRSFSRTLLKGFYHTQELAVHSPSHTHTHTEREREREKERETETQRQRQRQRLRKSIPLFTHKSKLMTDRKTVPDFSACRS